MVEGRERPDRAGHDRHRMSVAAETGEEPVHLLVRHRVIGDAVFEVEILLLVRQIAIKQNVAGLKKGAVLGELIYWVAAVKKNALLAVDIGDVGFARRGGGEAWVVGE